MLKIKGKPSSNIATRRSSMDGNYKYNGMNYKVLNKRMRK
jgi:hypothetical protein